MRSLHVLSAAPAKCGHLHQGKLSFLQAFSTACYFVFFFTAADQADQYFTPFTVLYVRMRT